MKPIYSIILLFLFSTTNAQSIHKIYGTWVKTKITYNDGRSLSIEDVLNYTYIKYKFTPNGKFNVSIAYNESGKENEYTINNNYLILKSPEGGLINSYHIKAFNDTLILVQQGEQGDTDASLLKYYFVKEEAYQGAIALSPADIYSVKGSDTIYKESPKIYASYNGVSFLNYVYAGISDRINLDGRVAHLVASFIVSKRGIADSVKIIEGVDNEFNNRFLKVFSQAKKDWRPGILNGKPVSVKMMIELLYSTSDTTIPAQFATQSANKAYLNKDYETALYYYDLALKSTPNDKENLFKRGMCKFNLGSKAAACEDWNKAMTLRGSIDIESILEKYCK